MRKIVEELKEIPLHDTELCAIGNNNYGTIEEALDLVFAGQIDTDEFFQCATSIISSLILRDRELQKEIV